MTSNNANRAGRGMPPVASEPAILPSSAGVPPGETRPVRGLAPLEPRATRDLGVSPSVGRAPGEAAAAQQFDGGDMSPPKPADRSRTLSPPAPAPSFEQVKGKRRS